MAYTAGPFNREHFLLQWGGALPGLETWSCSVRMNKFDAGEVLQAEAVAMLPAIRDVLIAHHIHIGTGINPQCKLEFAKLNVVKVDGTFKSPTTNQVAIAPVAGGGTANQYPNQIAMVATLETGFTRGPAHRGRFYSPMPTHYTQNDGRLSTVDQTTLETRFNALLTNLNAATGTQYNVAVFSRKLTSPAMRLVTSINIGRALDTQRRRRKNLVEAR